MTLTLASQDILPWPLDEQQHINIYARNQGRFLGCQSEESFNKTMACFNLPAPGPAMDVDEHAGTLDIFFNLDAPSGPGLVSFEFDLGGGCLSNWKPVSWHQHDDEMIRPSDLRTIAHV